MAKEPEQSETKVIVATAGPYSGQRLTVPAADADAAISDGWAKDPFAPPPEESQEPEQPMDDEMRAKVNEAAEKAARKLRGEDEPDDDKSGKKSTTDKNTKSLEADKPAASYQTRTTSKSK